MTKKKGTCPLCFGSKLDYTGKPCWLCEGRGFIEYKITYSPPSSYVDYKEVKVDGLP